MERDEDGSKREFLCGCMENIVVTGELRVGAVNDLRI